MPAPPGKKSSKLSKRPSLKHGRPPLSKSSPAGTKLPSLSSKHTRTLINTHHLLQKRLATARSTGDTAQIEQIETQLAAQGGLESYQLASRTGQGNDRGGDSSRVLVQWLGREIQGRKTGLRGSRPVGERGDVGENEDGQPRVPAGGSGKVELIRVLEVGALSTRNALNIPGVTDVRRIDLRSSEEGIEEMDFMKLSAPEAPNGEGERGYDVLSLSLVLNYVPDPKARGEMLKRTTLFLRPLPPPGLNEEQSDGRIEALPCLFLVLPLPCVDNSRYVTTEHLTSILYSLGYELLQSKKTRKLYYSLWRYDGPRAREQWARNGGQTVFKKKELKPGGGRNNFCIILENEA